MAKPTRANSACPYETRCSPYPNRTRLFPIRAPPVTQLLLQKKPSVISCFVNRTGSFQKMSFCATFRPHRITRVENTPPCFET
ncbi:unnamed protein product, partial [Nesidiocoris tenuis]